MMHTNPQVVKRKTDMVARHTRFYTTLMLYDLINVRVRGACVTACASPQTCALLARSRQPADAYAQPLLALCSGKHHSCVCVCPTGG